MSDSDAPKKPIRPSGRERDQAARKAPARPTKPAPRKNVVKPTTAKATTPDSQSTTPAATPKPTSLPSEEAVTTKSNQGPVKEHKEKKSSGKIIWIISVAILLLLMAGGAYLFLYTGFFAGNSDHAHADAEQVEPAAGEHVEESSAEDAEEPIPEEEVELEGNVAEEVSNEEETVEAVSDEQPKATPEPEPTVSSSSTAVSTSELKGKLIVSLVAVKDEATAKAVRQRFTEKGFSNAHYYYIPDVDPGGKALYKIYLGPFTDPGEAAKARDLAQKTNKQAYVVKVE